MAVDAAPTGADLPSPLEIGDTFQDVVVAYNAGLFFSDPDGPAVTTGSLSYETDNEQVVPATGALAITTDTPPNLTVDVTGNPGTAVVTVTFTEPATASGSADTTTGVGQYITKTFTVMK